MKLRLLPLCLVFILLACKEEVAHYQIDGPSGQPYEVVLYTNNTYKFRPLNESFGWMKGHWEGGIKKSDSLTLIIELNSMQVLRTFVVETDSLRSIESRIEEL